MEKKIFVSEKAKAHLRKVFKCTNPMVWKALNFKSDSDLARKIRYVALTELGGVPSWKPEDVETTHEEVEGTMTQTFGKRVRLVASKVDDSVTVYVDGKEARKAVCASIPEFMSLQNDVELMAMSL